MSRGLLRVLAFAVLAFPMLSCSTTGGDEPAGTSSTGAIAATTTPTTEGTRTTPATQTTRSTQASRSTPASESTQGSADGSAEGSGCTPPSGDTLPDGRWYGVVDAVGDAELTFDLACFFTGEAAVVAAAEDGEESPPPNGYHVRNSNDRVRIFEVSIDAPVTWYPDGGSPTEVTTVDYGQWLTDRQRRRFDLAVWLTISAGVVVEIDEQWVP